MAQIMSELEEVFTLEETAAKLKTEPKTLESLTRGLTPKIGFLRTGRVKTFPASAIQAYIDAYKVDAAPPNPYGVSDGALRNLNRQR